MIPRFLISILTYRVESGAEKCVESVMRGGGNGLFKIHLTANGPAAFDIFRKMKAKIPEVVNVVLNAQNLGFIEPNNKAFQYASDHCYDFLVLLNDDCAVPRGWLEAIEAEFHRHPSSAIVGVKNTCRSLTSELHGYEGSDLEYIDGACMAIRVSAIERHFKTLFPSYLEFCYGEDSALSLELRKLGWTIHQAGFQIEHNRGSTSQHVPEAKRSQAKNHEALKRRFAHYFKTRSFSHRIVVKRRYAIGDVLLASPVIRRLWQENPLCEIVVETEYPELFEGNPCVSMSAKDVGRKPTDLVVDLDGTYENTPMRHIVSTYARAAGVEVELPCKLEIYWRDDPFATMDWSGRWVALHTGPSTWLAKQWSYDKWNTLARELEDDGWNVILVGSGKLANVDCHDWRRDMRDRTTSMNQLAALLSHCHLFIGLDSAPLHVAQAVGIPAIGIFGITDSRFILTASNAVGVNADSKLWPRAGERHRVAGVLHVEENGDTINSVAVDQVLEAVGRLTAQEVAR